ncbi:J domain-containing protein [Yunchengibacter salinarum]|uniref:J domain-containing protein n=1 Tax=Yunchengibacter salinarum TaxID=3133399 RepID=UPI0035B62DBB
MAGGTRGFGFPRWGGYGLDKEAEAVRMCDYVGCSERGEHPAPKAPGSRERWYFCKAHAAEYNSNWDFFQGMTDEEARRYAERTGQASSDAFASANSFEWGGAAEDNGYTARENRAFDTLELDPGASQQDIKRQYRKLAKVYHPDANSGDPLAAEKFSEIRKAYDLLAQ